MYRQNGPCVVTVYGPTAAIYADVCVWDSLDVFTLQHISEYGKKYRKNELCVVLQEILSIASKNRKLIER